MADSISGLSLLADGFRRVGPVRSPRENAQFRERLRRAASGQGRAVQAGLAALRSWENLSALEAVLPPRAFGPSLASRRILQRALHAFGTPAGPAAALASAARGTPACVVGRVVRGRSKLLSHIWTRGESSIHNVRLLVEEGHDFFLNDSRDPGLREVLILVAGGGMIGNVGAAIDTGDLVEVFGFVDRVIDQGSRLGASTPRGEPLVLALRAGDQLPLLVRKVEKDHAPPEPDERT
jgi:hypothetical protein